MTQLRIQIERFLQPLLFYYPELRAQPFEFRCCFGQHGCVRLLSLHCLEESTKTKINKFYSKIYGVLWQLEPAKIRCNTSHITVLFCERQSRVLLNRVNCFESFFCLLRLHKPIKITYICLNRIF